MIDMGVQLLFLMRCLLLITKPTYHSQITLFCFTR